MINEGMVAVLSNLENAYVKRGYCVVSRNIDVNWLTGIQWHLITVPTLHITHYLNIPKGYYGQRGSAL